MAHHRPGTTAWIVCAVAAALAGVARGEVERVGTESGSGITIEIEGWAGINTPATGRRTGLIPLDVSITNDSPATRTWTFAPDSSFGSRRAPVPSASLTVPEGGTGRTTLFVEVDEQGDLYLTVKGHGVTNGEQMLRVESPSERWARLSDQQASLGPSVGQSREVLASRAGRPTDLDVTPLDMTRAPGDWRGWSAFHTIVITAAEWRALPAAARKAALDWTLLGGRLVVLTKPDEEPPAGLLPGRRQDREAVRGGKAIVAPWTDERIPPGQITRYGGEFAAVDMYINDSTADDVRYGFPRDGWFTTLTKRFGPRTLPVTPILLFLAVFGLVAGPLNVWVLAGRGRRSRMFWTTPAISLAATALLLALIFLRDGVGGEGVRRVLAILDPDRATMGVIQEQFSRTGVLLGSSFPIREPSWMHPIGKKRNDVPLVENDGAVRSGGWFRSRSDQAFVLQAARPSRARIEFQPPAAASAAPSIVSSVEVPLRRAFVIDDDGRYWRADDIGTGERKALQPAERADFERWFGEFTADAGPVRRRALDNVKAGRGRAFAEADRPARLAIETLGSIRWVDDRALVVCPVTTETQAATEPAP